MCVRAVLVSSQETTVSLAQAIPALPFLGQHHRGFGLYEEISILPTLKKNIQLYKRCIFYKLDYDHPIRGVELSERVMRDREGVS
jgi:hypothetical protein